MNSMILNDEHVWTPGSLLIALYKGVLRFVRVSHLLIITTMSVRKSTKETVFVSVQVE